MIPTIPGSWQTVLVLAALGVFALGIIEIIRDERQKNRPMAERRRPWYRRIWRGSWPKSQHPSYFQQSRQWRK